MGRTLPAHASATGKAILAFGPRQQVEAVIAAGLPALTERTITDPMVLRVELEQTRQLGYATESAESATNLSCLSAPVWGDSAGVVGAVALCIPIARLPVSHPSLDARLRLDVTDGASERVLGGVSCVRLRPGREVGVAARGCRPRGR